MLPGAKQVGEADVDDLHLLALGQRNRFLRGLDCLGHGVVLLSVKFLTRARGLKQNTSAATACRTEASWPLAKDLFFAAKCATP